jgi:hypothetical protein
MGFPTVLIVKPGERGLEAVEQVPAPGPIRNFHRRSRKRIRRERTSTGISAGKSCGDTAPDERVLSDAALQW